MKQESNQLGNEHNAHDDKQITVTVNNKPVTFETNKANGSEIKATAIAQHVQIQQDFNLFERAGESNNWKPVGDNEVVTLNKNKQFRAVAPDDNSMY